MSEGKVSNQPDNVVPLLPENDEVPDWARPGEHIPKQIKWAFKGIPSQVEVGFWEKHEREALTSIFQNDSLMPVFDHLQKFELKNNEWREVIGVFVEAFAFVKNRVNEERASMEENEALFYQELSSKAYELFCLLNHPQYPSNDTDLGHLLSNSGLPKDLMKLISVSTSASWPKKYHEWLSDADASFQDFNEIELMMNEETPWYEPANDGEVDCEGFPPPIINHGFNDELLNKRWEWTRFLSVALEKLDGISHRYRRSFELHKGKGNKMLVNGRTCVFLEPMHWRLLLSVLFGDHGSPKDVYQSQTINKIIKEHRSQSPFYT